MAAKRAAGPGLAEILWLGLRHADSYIVRLDWLFSKYGSYAQSGLPGARFFGAFHPEAVEHVLKTNAKNYLKADDLQQLYLVLGQGLLTSEGEQWKKHRKLIGPEFQNKRVDGFFPVMMRHLDEMLRGWRSGETVNVVPAITKATYGVAGECFFGVHVQESSEVVYEAVEITSDLAVRRMASPLHPPLSWPLPAHRRARAAAARMNAIVYDIIDARMRTQAEQHPAQDVLSRLTRIKDESGALELTREQIRDEVMTLLLAGHETTANALAWTLYLLGQHPKIQEDLRDELQAEVSGFVPTLEELKRLRFTKMVVEESMRLYPPAAVLGRKPIADDEIAGHPVAAGSKVILSQWLTHRHPEFWPRPTEFLPERFAEPKHHPYAYFPFAAGPRECIGRNMAMVEAMAFVAGMIKNFRFELTDQKVGVRPLITLRPDPGIFMKVTSVPKHSQMQSSLTV